MSPPPGHPMPASHTGRDRAYIGMREVSATDSVEQDFVSQDALKHHLAVQAAIAARDMKNAERRKWIAVAVGLALLIALLAALLMANAADVWR
ncbi:MAG: hypothetical protein JWP60_3326 [Ramlibacter sp.]|nr:hypothetical protein [Ramlibacter sp.]